MTTSVTILFMIVIGALIGGITNDIAIRMLFRPHEAKYIGKWKLPFTPGIIPKRRDELARQLGEMVSKYLLTPDGIKKKLEEETFKNQINSWTRNEVEKILNSEKTLQEFGEMLFKIDIEKEVKNKIEIALNSGLDEFLKSSKEKTVLEIVPSGMIEKVEEKVPFVANEITERMVEYFESEKGKQKLEQVTNQLLEEKKLIKGFVGMFVGNEKLTDKVQIELVTLLRKQSTQESLQEVLNKELNKIKWKKVEDIIEWVDEKNIREITKEKIYSKIPFEKYLHTPVNTLTEPYKETIKEKWLPNVIDKAGKFLVKEVEIIMERFDLATIVREQVEGFPVQRLEDLIMGIVKKEFKMITYLGAALGGIIGLIQGIIATTL